MTRVLVTGGSGFVGSHLVDHLSDAGNEVAVFDAVPPRPDTAGRIRYVQGDVRDEEALGKAFANGVDIVYHLSAVVGVDKYLAVPADVVEINLLGTLNVLRHARAAQAKIVIASTSEVYGKNPVTPWQEDADRVLGSTAVDRWSYSTSKALAEHLTFAYMRQHGVQAAIVRFFNVYVMSTVLASAPPMSSAGVFTEPFGAWRQKSMTMEARHDVSHMSTTLSAGLYL
jgi:UDP-glucose 4-epimerase